ncbi:MAG: hypothetical protein JWR69_4160, partial [Pedosphaera sp.]|nr:hypothetical protein [Pedosphaera sp.]
MTTKQFLISGWDWNPAVAAAGAAGLASYFVIYGSSSRPRAWLLGLGLILFCVAVFSPIGTLAKGYLFSAHMTQHLLLLLIVPALVLMGLPKRVAKNPQPDETGKGTRLPVKGLALSWLAGVGALWFWHISALCNAAAASAWIQGVQTVSLLVLGGMFWWPLLGPRT